MFQTASLAPNHVIPAPNLTCHLDCERRLVKICYTPKTKRPIFDVCDLNGRVLLASKSLSQTGAEIPYDLLDYGCTYAIWIIDGDAVLRTRFCLEEPC